MSTQRNLQVVAGHSHASSVTTTEQFEKACKVLALLDRIGPSTRLLPVDQCKAVIDQLDTELKAASWHDAEVLAAELCDRYPHIKPNNPEVYFASLARVFADFPKTLGKRVCDPVRGLPSRLAFPPTVAELKLALDEEQKRVAHIRANALSHMAELRRRQREQAKDEEFNRNRKSESERKEIVARLLGRSTPS